MVAAAESQAEPEQTQVAPKVIHLMPSSETEQNRLRMTKILVRLVSHKVRFQIDMSCQKSANPLVQVVHLSNCLSFVAVKYFEMHLSLESTETEWKPRPLRRRSSLLILRKDAKALLECILFETATAVQL